MDKKIGVLEAGYLADIIATNEDPTANVKTVTDVIFVMKEGVVYKSN
jgi:imidazolonepropionase-like amidohydrolase